MNIKLPPQYVNLPAFLIYSDLPQSLIVTASRIYGLAWNKNRQYSPEDRMHAPVQFDATLQELMTICRLAERTLKGHLSDLSGRGVLRYTHSMRLNVYIFTLPPRSQWPSLPDFERYAENCTPLSSYVVDDLPIFSFEDQQQPSLCIGGGCGGEVEECEKLHSSPGADVSADELMGRLACLDYLEIHEPKRSTLAAQEDITVDYLMGWVGDKQRHLERGGGFYVLQIEARVPVPEPRDYLYPPEHLADLRRPATYDEMPEPPEEWEEEEILPAPDAKLAGRPVDPSVTEAIALKWSACLGELALQMTQATFDTWLKGAQLVAVRDHTLVVAVQSQYAVDWLSTRLADTIHRTLHRLVGEGTEVEFVTREAWRERADAHLVMVTR